MASSYDEAMDALSSLITKRSRADKSNKGDRFDFLFDYVKVNPLIGHSSDVLLRICC